MIQGAKLAGAVWGVGCCWSAPDGVRGEPAPAPVATDRLQEIADTEGAASAIDQLVLASEAEGLPDLAEYEFAGAVAEAFFFDDNKVTGIQGPVGSGKTDVLMRKRLRRAMQMPRSVIDGVRYYKCIFSRQTYREVWSTTIPSYLDVFPRKWGTWAGGRGDPVTHVIRFEDDYGEIEFTAEFKAYGDDVVAAMRGTQTTDWVLNEADTQVADLLSNAITRIDRWPARKHFASYPPELQTYGQIDCDMNAMDQDNWAYGFFHDEKKRKQVGAELTVALRKEHPSARAIQINFHKQPGGMEPTAENKQNLAPGYYETQIATLRLQGRGDLIDRLVHNKNTFLRVGEPVFKDHFRRHVHVSETTIEPDPSRPLLLGFDQGYRPAMVVCQYDLGGFWTTLAELMFPKEHLLARVFGKRCFELINDRFPGMKIGGAWGDMAGEQGAAQADDSENEKRTWNLVVGKELGIRVRPQRIGANRIDPRLEALRSSLDLFEEGRPGELIDPSCTYLISGYEARYVWTEEINKSGDKRKVPDKSFVEANVMDARQYVALSKVRGDGLSPRSTPDRDRRSKMGHNQGPPMGGIETGFNILDPYGR